MCFWINEKSAGSCDRTRIWNERVIRAQINITVYFMFTTHFSTWRSLNPAHWEPAASEDGRRHIRPNGFGAGAGGSADPHAHMFS